MGISYIHQLFTDTSQQQYPGAASGQSNLGKPSNNETTLTILNDDGRRNSPQG